MASAIDGAIKTSVIATIRRAFNVRIRPLVLARARLVGIAGGLIVGVAVVASLSYLIVWAPHSFQSADNSNNSIFPDLTGRVVDEAGLLSESEKRELTANLKSLEDKNTDQVVVVTVLSLDGYSMRNTPVASEITGALGHARKIMACFWLLPRTNIRSALRLAAGSRPL